MKLIIAGSTSYVGTEIIRQALSNPAITSLVALARRDTAVPANLGASANPSKLKSVACDNFEKWPENVRKEVEGADACIWLIAITPSKLSSMPFEEATKICRDYTTTGLETLAQLPRPSPFRFIYTSGSNTERDPAKKPWIFGDYILMRGETETRVLSIAAKATPPISVAIARPGLIGSNKKPGPVMKVLQTIGRSIIGLPALELEFMAAALIDQAVGGFEKELLENEDLARIGRKALGREE